MKYIKLKRNTTTQTKLEAETTYKYPQSRNQPVRKMDIFTLIFATISLNFLLTLFFRYSPPSKPLELSLFTWHDTWTLYHRNGRALRSLASSIIREVDGRTPLVILPTMPSVAAGQPVVDRLPTTWGLP